MFRIGMGGANRAATEGWNQAVAENSRGALAFRAGERPTTQAGDEGMRAEMTPKFIAMCGVVLMLAGCAQPEWSCTGNGGTTHNSGALCSGLIPLSW